MQQDRDTRAQQSLQAVERGSPAVAVVAGSHAGGAVESPVVLLAAIAIVGFLLAGLCFYWYFSVPEVALLLVGLVTFGMSYDFLNHVLGHWLPRQKRLLQVYARINFAALCFGIPFTAYAGSFVLAAAIDGPISQALVRNYLPVLHGSVAFGALFLFARYKEVVINGAVEYVLDKSHRFTRIIFILRRVLLAFSLLVALTVLYDALGTAWLLWAVAFNAVFIATIPLHILHKQVPSMLGELVTQMIAVYGCWLVFVAP